MSSYSAADAPEWSQGVLERRAWAVGAVVAARFADDVDRHARFPSESVAALRDDGLLAAMVPLEFGGEGASFTSIAMATRALASHCAATALVFAMHQIEICYLVGHGQTEALQDLLRKVVTDGLLIANANSEVGIGGDMSRSLCALEHGGGRFRLQKDALAVSYGQYADAIMVTARRGPDSTPNDQVLVACGPGTFRLTKTSEWDTVGLRGTCSSNFTLEAEESEGMILPAAWSSIATHNLGATTILLNSVWLGIAESAASRAHAFVRAEARKKIGETPSSAHVLAELAVTLGEARSVMATCISRFEEATGTEAIEDATLILALRNLKISSTTLAIQIVTKALSICGLAGYKRDSPYSMDRNLRDVLGGPVMANNRRYYAENAILLTALKQI